MRWVLAFHIISVVCWFAGLFYLPRLFVYHTMSHDEQSNQRFKVMERKLYNAITTPSMIATVFFGLWLLHYNFYYYFHTPWMIAKLILVIILLIYHVYCGVLVKDFRNNNNRHSEKFYRIFNEIPAVLLIAIVILVVVQPSF